MAEHQPFHEPFTIAERKSIRESEFLTVRFAKLEPQRKPKRVAVGEPVAVADAEFEHVDYWEQHGPLLRAAWRELGLARWESAGSRAGSSMSPRTPPPPLAGGRARVRWTTDSARMHPWGVRTLALAARARRENLLGRLIPSAAAAPSGEAVPRGPYMP